MRTRTRNTVIGSTVTAAAIASHAVILVAAWGPEEPTPVVAVAGRVALLERGNKFGTDVGQAVVWLDVPGAEALPPNPTQVITEGKEFRPRVSLVPVGSTISFPNNDPFNHNVFSLSEDAPFDLGLYGRGQVRSTTLKRAGLIRVYCNVHARMAAFLLVRDNGFTTQPGADGSFTIEGVPPGKYQLHVWHERAQPIVQTVEVPAAGLKDLDLQLDARAYKFVQHLNKFGQPYPKGGSRY